MAAGCVHTVFKRESWVNEIEDGGELAGLATKYEAVLAGRQDAKNRQTDHVVHNVDGSISQRHSYGKDPASRPGSSSVPPLLPTFVGVG